MKKTYTFFLFLVIGLSSIKSKAEEKSYYATVLHKSEDNKVNASLMIEESSSKCDFLFLDPLGRKVEPKSLIPEIELNCALRDILNARIFSSRGYWILSSKKKRRLKSIFGSINFSQDDNKNWRFKEVTFKTKKLSWLIKYHRKANSDLLKSEFFDLKNNSQTIFIWKELKK